MSLIDFHILAEKEDIEVVIALTPPPVVTLETISTPDVLVIASGNVGPPGPVGPPGIQGVQGPEGPQGQWVSLTQAEYDALTPPDPETLYVIVE